MLNLIKANKYTPLFSSLFILFLLSVFVYDRFSGRLFNGVDGPSYVSESEIQSSFFGTTLYLHSNILEGLGTTPNTLNLTNKPLIYQNTNGQATYTPQLFYTWFTIQLFITVLLVGWNYHFNRKITHQAAWLLTIILFPFIHFRIYSITDSIPAIIEAIFVFALIDIGVQRMGAIDWKNTIKYAVVLLLGILYGLIFCPTAFVIIAPALFLTTIHAFLKKATPLERYRKLTLLVGIFLLSLICGWVEYVCGLLLNTVTGLFSEQMTGFYHSLIYASIVFNGPYPGSLLGPYFFCSATLGMLIAIHRSTRLRSIALTILTLQILITGIGTIVMLLPKPWLGPSFIYFEMMIFPFYALFTAYFFQFTLASIKHFSLVKKFSFPEVFYYFLFIITLVILQLVQPVKHRRGTSYGLPPASSEITDILEKEIGLNLNSIFNGRVANILPNTDWLKQCAYFFKVNIATGNDHQSAGLWLKHIPTLHEYHQEINPGFYSLYRRFLSEPDEEVYRNWTSFSKFNFKILRLLGVRFIITTETSLPQAKMRKKLNFQNHDIMPLYLYEIEGANIAGIAASHIKTINSISEIEDMMASDHFQLWEALILSNEKLTGDDLKPTIHSTLRIEKGGFHLQAESLGKTLLILPLEFSHCLKATIVSGTKPTIIRVDGALAGVLFHHKVDILLDDKIGPFANQRCMFKDYREFKRLWKHTA